MIALCGIIGHWSLPGPLSKSRVRKIALFGGLENGRLGSGRVASGRLESERLGSGRFASGELASKGLARGQLGSGAVVTTNNSPIVSRLLLDFSMMKKSLYLEGKNSEKLFSMPAPPPLPLHGSGWFNPNILSFDYNYLSIQAKKLHKHSICR